MCSKTKSGKKQHPESTDQVDAFLIDSAAGGLSDKMPEFIIYKEKNGALRTIFEFDSNSKMAKGAMNKKQQVTDTISAQGFLPLYFNANEEISLSTLKALYRAGVKAAEYTNRGDAALNNFKKLMALRNAEMPGLFLGAGTIKNKQQAADYIAAGADFLVSPGFVPDVAAYSVANNILYIPGCMTPGEIIVAENAGIKFIKLFPGNLLGTEFLVSTKDIFPGLLFMVTGGVDISKESIENWFKAGVCVVGLGSRLITKEMMEQKDFAAMEKGAKKILELIASLKK